MLVKLSGELDIAVKEEVRARLDDAAKDSTRVDIDLSEVAYADSTALGLFIGLRNRLREKGGDVRFVAPSARMRKLLGYAGLEQAFEIVDASAS
jgi:anti-sigma B factor antagonist